MPRIPVSAVLSESNVIRLEVTKRNPCICKNFELLKESDSTGQNAAHHDMTGQPGDITSLGERGEMKS